MLLLISNRLPSRTRSYSTGTRVFWFRFWIIPEPPAPVPLDKGNGGSGNEIAREDKIRIPKQPCNVLFII